MVVGRLMVTRSGSAGSSTAGSSSSCPACGGGAAGAGPVLVEDAGMGTDCAPAAAGVPALAIMARIRANRPTEGTLPGFDPEN